MRFVPSAAANAEAAAGDTAWLARLSSRSTVLPGMRNRGGEHGMAVAWHVRHEVAGIGHDGSMGHDGAQQTKWRHDFIAAVNGEPACSHEHQPCICAPASASARLRQPSSSTLRMRSTQSDARVGSLRLTRSTRSSMPRGAPHAMAGAEGCQAGASTNAGCGHGRQWRGGVERRRRRGSGGGGRADGGSKGRRGCQCMLAPRPADG